MNIKKAVVGFLILTLLASPYLGWAKEDKTFPSAEALQQFIDFVVENNPILRSQKRIIVEMESIPLPERIWDADLTVKGGVGTKEDEDTHVMRIVPSVGLELEIPLYDPSKERDILQERVAFNEKLEQAKQKYNSLKNSIVSDLLNKVARLSQLDNEKENLIKLKSYLKDNLSSLEKQVKAGVEEPDTLWALNERIMNLDTKIYNLSSQFKALKWEIAITLGGEKWQKLLQLLDEIGI